MGTRSSITAKCEDGKFKTIYCHWDGYPSHNGKILLEDFQDQAKIEAMIELGDMSSLGRSIECPEGHSYDDPAEGHSVFYTRDRGEEGVDCIICDTLEECPS